jgi:hypothetical protein
MFGEQSYFKAPADLFILNPNAEGFITGGKRTFGNVTFFNGCFAGCILGVFMVIGVIAAVAAVQESNVRSRLAQSGVDMQATVTDRRISVSTDSKGRRSTTYYLTYDYYVGKGNSDNPTLYHIERHVTSGTYNGFPNGSKIPIRYLRDDPNISRIVGDRADDPGLMLLVTVGFTVVPIIAIVFVVRQYTRTRRLEREGQLLHGRVAEAKGSRGKNGYQVRISYTFISPEGETIKGSESRIRNDLRDAPLPASGTPVAVVYVGPGLYRMV